MAENRESRPTSPKVETASVSDGDLNLTSVALGLDVLLELDALAAHVDGAFVVVVKVAGTRHKRRCYLTAKAAENAAQRAIERGESATVYLAELKPVWRIGGVA